MRALLFASSSSTDSKQAFTENVEHFLNRTKRFNQILLLLFALGVGLLLTLHLWGISSMETEEQVLALRRTVIDFDEMDYEAGLEASKQIWDCAYSKSDSSRDSFAQAKNCAYNYIEKFFAKLNIETKRETFFNHTVLTAVVRADHTDGTQSLSITTSLNLNNCTAFNKFTRINASTNRPVTFGESLPEYRESLEGVGVLLGLAHSLKNLNWLAKDIVFVISDGEENEIVMKEWLDNYLSMNKIAGSLFSALCIEMGRTVNGKFSGVNVRVASGGRLPNGDLLTLTNPAAHGFTVIVGPSFDRNCELNRSTLSVSKSVRFIQSLPFLNPKQKSTLAFILEDFFSFPNGIHTLFNRKRIDAITLQTVSHFEHSKVGEEKYAIMVWNMMRSLSNLIQKLHRSSFFYIPYGPLKVSFLSQYWPIIVVLSVAFALHFLNLILSYSLFLSIKLSLYSLIPFIAFFVVGVISSLFSLLLFLVYGLDEQYVSLASVVFLSLNLLTLYIISRFLTTRFEEFIKENNIQDTQERENVLSVFRAFVFSVSLIPLGIFIVALFLTHAASNIALSLLFCLSLILGIETPNEMPVKKIFRRVYHFAFLFVPFLFLRFNYVGSSDSIMSSIFGFGRFLLPLIRSFFNFYEKAVPIFLFLFYPYLFSRICADMIQPKLINKSKKE